MTPRRGDGLVWSVVALALAGILAAGCASDSKGPQNRARSSSTGADDLVNKPGGLARTMAAQVAVLPLGTIAYDQFTLPLISPDGRHIATQTGEAPTWPMALAEMAGGVPSTSRVEIYRPDWRKDIKPSERQSPEFVAAVDDQVLLGRASDNEGFLVEAPREEGSRWIGKVNWSDGQINWLVHDSDVNAFAALGPRGQLAFSHRAAEQVRFDLVIESEGGKWTIDSAGADWLMPTWSGRGDGLYVLRLQDGRLELMFLDASSEEAMRESIGHSKVMLTIDATVRSAYQTLTGQPSITILPSAQMPEQIVFFHPAQGCMAVWRPLGSSRLRPTLLAAASLAAIADDLDSTIVAGQGARAKKGRLIHQRISATSDWSELLTGLFVPRQISDPAWPYLLLLIDNDTPTQLGLTAMRLLPPGEPG